MKSLTSPRRRVPHDAIEILEARIAPATLVSLDPATHVLTVQGDYVDDGSSNVQPGASENLSFSVTAQALTISDSTHHVTAMSANVSQAGLNQVTIPLSALTGDLAIDTGTGADSLGFAGALALSVNKSLLAKTIGTITVSPTAALSATGTGQISLTTERDIAIATGATVSVVNGNLDLTAHGTVTGNYSGILVLGSSVTALASSGFGHISLDGRGGDSGTNNFGLDLEGNIATTGAGPLLFKGKGGAGLDGNTGIATLAGSGSISAGLGGIVFDGTPGSPGPSTLGINLAIGVTSAGEVDFLADQGLAFGPGGAVNAGTGGLVTFTPKTPGTPIFIGNAQQTAFAVSRAMLAATTASLVVIGDPQAGAISIDNFVDSDKALNLITGSTVTGWANVGQVNLALTAGLSIQAGGNIQFVAPISVGGLLSLTGVGGDIDISLAHASNTFSTVHVARGGNVELWSDNAGFAFDAQVSNLLTLKSVGGISQSGPISGGGNLLKLGALRL